MAYNKKIIKEEIDRMIKNENIFDAPAAFIGGLKGAGQNLVGNFRTNAVKTRMNRLANKVEKEFEKNIVPAEKTAERMAASSNQSVKATGQNILNQLKAADDNLKQSTSHLRQAFPSSVGQVINKQSQQQEEPSEYQTQMVQPSQKEPHADTGKDWQQTPPETAKYNKPKRPVQQDIGAQITPQQAQQQNPQMAQQAQPQQIEQPPVQQNNDPISKFLSMSGLPNDEKKEVDEYLRKNPKRAHMLRGMNKEMIPQVAKRIVDLARRKDESKSFKLAEWLI